MQTVGSIEELREVLAAGGRCKIRLHDEAALLRTLLEAGVADRAAGPGIALVPRGVTNVLLAAIAETDTAVARAALEGYRLGLRRKAEGWFLYLDDEACRAARRRVPMPRAERRGEWGTRAPRDPACPARPRAVDVRLRCGKEAEK